MKPDFDDIVRECGQALWRLTAAYARANADREDLYQEILVAVWQALPAFRGASSLRTYVYRIAHSRGLTWRARAARGAVTDEPADMIPDPRLPPDERLDRVLQRERLTAALRALPATLSQPLALHLEGLSYAQIAEVLGITENNVGVRLSRARAALALRLGPGGTP